MRKRNQLDIYHRKRDFGTTPEPRVPLQSKKSQRMAAGRQDRPVVERKFPTFVVQRHAARRLHYDFRLEHDGVLKSWAVPKGPSRDARVQRLAVEVEDHPLAYASFEGEIPPGQYGAGTVTIWDAGTWTPRGDVDAGLKKGHLRFTLQGERLRGEWALIRTGSENQWLLRKLKDEHVLPGDDAEASAPPAHTASTAAKSGNADGYDAAPSPLSTGESVPPSRPRKPGHGNGTRTPPLTMQPQLASLANEPPRGSTWTYEIKYDGYRMLCRIAPNSSPQFFSRTGIDWSDRMSSLVQAMHGRLPGVGWIDGEVVVFDEQGRSSFQALQNALDSRNPNLQFVVFDLLWWNGKDLRSLPLAERYTQLEQLLEAVPDEAPISLVDRLPISDAATAPLLLAEVCKLGLEGLIAKNTSAPYTAERSQTWLKLKCRPRQEFVVGGYTRPGGSRKGFGALLLGVYQKGELHYAGRVGSGFDSVTLDSLHARLRQLHTDTNPFAEMPPTAHRYARNARPTLHWVRPEMVVEVAFSERTHDGLLRQASFLGIREDKPATQVGQEDTAKMGTATNEATLPASSSGTRGRRQGASKTKPAQPRRSDDAGQSIPAAPPRRSGRVAVHGVRITNPDRLVYTSPPITKLEVAQYYEAVAPVMLEHLKKRRLAFLRCPEGTSKSCFFQKHISERLPDGLARDGEHILVDKARGLIELAQRGVIEIHTWGSTLPRADRADRLTLDLDPGPDVDWATLVEAAQLTATVVRELGLTPFLKTTGGKGLHLVMPIRRTLNWDQAKGFAAGIARHLSTHLPDRFTANMSKKRRVGRVFVDYLRNGENATAIAAYSLRAREGAPVSMPIRWDELNPDQDLRGPAFNLHNALARMGEHPDPWNGYADAAITITKKLLEQMS